jgi:hypothetical protein
VSIKVELGFTESGASAPFFTLDDPVLGVLDSPLGLLGGGEILIEVTQYVRSFAITRGKSRELDRYGSGQARVEFNNNDRTFDPTYAASPYFGQIEPRRQIRISVDNVIQFEGTIDDWNIDYNAGGNSVATAMAFDGIANLANLETENLTLTEATVDNQLNQVLDNVNWPSSKRDLDVSTAVLAGSTVNDGTNALGLLQLMTDSEPGDLFVSKTGNVKFVGRNQSFRTGNVILSDDGTAISYTAVKVIFGSELLFNAWTVENLTNQILVKSDSSIGLYGERDATRNTLLKNTTDLQTLGDFLLTRYDAPEYRFESLSVNLKLVSPADRADLLDLELGDVVRVDFTPSGIPPTIERYGKVIRLGSSFADNEEIMEIGLEAVAGALLILDDPEFGKLDVALLGW